MQNNKNKTGLADYISDKNIFAATMFARKMISDGTAPGLAIYKAARYYRVNESEVAKYVGQHAGRVNAERNKKESKELIDKASKKRSKK